MVHEKHGRCVAALFAGSLGVVPSSASSRQSSAVQWHGHPDSPGSEARTRASRRNLPATRRPVRRSCRASAVPARRPPGPQRPRTATSWSRSSTGAARRPRPRFLARRPRRLCPRPHRHPRHRRRLRHLGRPPRTVTLATAAAARGNLPAGSRHDGTVDVHPRRRVQRDLPQPEPVAAGDASTGSRRSRWDR